MIPVYVPCASCGGNCHVQVFAVGFDSPIGVRRCSTCDGLGRQWAPGAPAYGRTVILADREPGEIVTLGNDQRAKILWHQPRKRPKVTPETTFLDLLDTSDFFERETFKPVPYPSCIGVSSVDAPRTAGDREAHDRERAADLGDPLQRQRADLLQHSVRAPDDPF